MFRKLVSNIAFSPALVSQLGFYAKRLRKEETTRRIGLIFTVLALVVQSFAVFSPPESANASNPSNFIDGGVTSLQDYLNHYDANTNNIRDLYNTLGITRQEMAAAKLQYLNSKSDGLISWGLTSHYSYAQGERTYTIQTSTGAMRTYYNRPLTLWDSANNVTSGSNYYVYVGYSAKLGWFGLMKVCGNLVTKTVPPPPQCPVGMVGTYPNCTPPPKMCTIPGKTTITADDARCKYEPVARCERLSVTPLANSLYQLDGKTYTDHGATISKYTYVIKRGGIVVETHPASSTSNTNQYVFDSKGVEGDYTIELIVQTSLGEMRGNDCSKTFHIAAPEKCPQNPSLLKNDPECQPCPGDATLWIKDQKCKASLVETKTAQNTTQGKDATSVVAKPSDKIVYSLNVENKGLAPTSVSIREELSDVLEYSSVIDNGSGTLSNKVLTWPTITLKPGEKQTRMFTVQVFNTIPAMGEGVSDKTSYDCKITNTFGNSVDISVDCPVQKKIIEQTVSQLPHTGPAENMLFAGSILAVVSYFYARSRQMKKEVRLIRRELNSGTI